MKCPCCKTILIQVGQGRFQNLVEHVTAPNKFPDMKDKHVCLNDGCKISPFCFWDSDGSFYINDYTGYKSVNGDKCFIDGNNGAFGSWARKAYVEIYKDDENYEILRIGKFKFRMTYQYESNENGDILKRRRKIEIWIKSRNVGYTHYVSGIRMLKHIIQQFHADRKWRSTPDIISFSKSLHGRGEWWRKVGHWYICKYSKLFPVKNPNNLKG